MKACSLIKPVRSPANDGDLIEPWVQRLNQACKMFSVGLGLALRVSFQKRRKNATSDLLRLRCTTRRMGADIQPYLHDISDGNAIPHHRTPEDRLARCRTPHIDIRGMFGGFESEPKATQGLIDPDFPSISMAGHHVRNLPQEPGRLKTSQDMRGAAASLLLLAELNRNEEQ